MLQFDIQLSQLHKKGQTILLQALKTGERDSSNPSSGNFEVGKGKTANSVLASLFAKPVVGVSFQAVLSSSSSLVSSSS